MWRQLFLYGTYFCLCEYWVINKFEWYPVWSSISIIKTIAAAACVNQSVGDTMYTYANVNKIVNQNYFKYLTSKNSNMSRSDQIRRSIKYMPIYLRISCIIVLFFTYTHLQITWEVGIHSTIYIYCFNKRKPQTRLTTHFGLMQIHPGC